MRITKHTDYALRVLLYLAVRPNERISTQVIAESYDISVHHLQKVVRALGQNGWIQLHRGGQGGVELAKAPDKISVGEVMRAMDDRDNLVECFKPETNLCVITPSCGLKSALRDAQEAFYEHLDPILLSELLERRTKALRKLTDG
ncbi:UNVERIFIED_CONTAM: hypothetical protein GTU68_007768 [Idotea baltica]|nr:hypothetical protein [Idotea baltica]